MATAKSTTVRDPLAGVTLTPEQELLVCCARLRLDVAHSLRVDELFRGSLDFTGLFRTAEIHGMLPFLARHLLADGREMLPAPEREHLRHSVWAIGVRNAFLTSELIRVIAAFRAAGISAVPFKGAAVALDAYGNIALRQFCDLDILVDFEDLDAAAGALTQAGYEAFHPVASRSRTVLRRVEYSESFVHVRSGTLIELHWRFGPAWFHFPVDLRFLSPRLSRVQVAGLDLPMLGPEDTLLVLCAHGTRHLWARLEWICLVAEFVRKHNTMDWKDLATRASAVGGRRMISLGLLMSRDLIGLSLPSKAERYFGPGDDAASLAADLRANLFRRRSHALRPAEIAIDLMRARERKVDQLRHVVGLAFEPTITEVTSLKLPPRLRWLYYFVRPLRLSWRYGVVAVFRRWFIRA